MTDEENAAEIMPKKLSNTSPTNDRRSKSTVNAHTASYSFHESVASIVNNGIVKNNEDLPLFSSRQIYKNLAILSIVFLLLYTAFQSIIALQSSLNTKDNVGINTLIIINALFSVRSYL